jgi:hypothetical protein
MDNEQQPGIIRRFFRFFAEGRGVKRQPASDRVLLTWRDKYGEGNVYGVCRDISDQGIGIECLEPIPLRRVVTVRLESRGRSRTATVKYRVKSGPGYLVGLEFTTVRNSRPARSRRSELDMATDGMTW